MIGVLLIYINILVNYYDNKLLHFICSFWVQFTGHISMFVLLFDILFIVFYCALLMMMCMTLLKNIHNEHNPLFKSNMLNSKKGLLTLHQDISKFMDDHNDFCRLTYEYNRFWSKIYFIIFFTMLPISLIMIHTIFFEQTDLGHKLLFTISTLMIVINCFAIQFILAYMSKQIHKGTKDLARLQWYLKGWPFRVNNKLKLMTYFERLSANKKIGLTLGPTVTVTFNVFAQVFHSINDNYLGNLLNSFQIVIRYIRYFLLIHKISYKLKE